MPINYKQENEIFITWVRWLAIIGSPFMIWFFQNEMPIDLAIISIPFVFYNLIMQLYLLKRHELTRYSVLLSVIDIIYLTLVYFYTLQRPGGLPQLYYFLILVMGMRHSAKYTWMVLISGILYAVTTMLGSQYFKTGFDTAELLNQLLFFTAFGVMSSYVFDRNFRQQLERDDLISELQAAYQQLCVYNAQVEELANTDPLTGLYNYRFFTERLQKELELSKRFDHCTSLIILDLDHFKEFNDKYGHPAGDRALQEAANVFGQNIRDKDVLCRYGGEEFLILLPSTGLEEAFKCAERIRESVQQQPIYLDDHKGPLFVTVSGGVACYPVDAQSGDELMRIADEVLYVAKHKGRNKIHHRVK